MLATPEQLTAWSSEQAKVTAPWLDARDADLPLTTFRTETQDFADLVLSLGGDIGPLRPCLTSEGWLNLDEVRRWAAEMHSVGIVYRTHFWSALDHATRGFHRVEYTLSQEVLIVGEVPSDYSGGPPFDWKLPRSEESPVFVAVLGALRSVWGLAKSPVVDNRVSLARGDGFTVSGRAAVVGRPRSESERATPRRRRERW